MISWLAPFIVLAVALFLYLYVARGSRATARDAMKRDINFYLVAVLAVAIVSIIANMTLEKDWLDMAAWVLAAVAVGGIVWKFVSTPRVDVVEPEDRGGPLDKK